MTEATKTPEVLETKAKQADGTYKTYSAELALPPHLAAFAETFEAASDDLQRFIMECAELGAKGKARNHLISGRLSSPITYQAILDAQLEAAAAKGQQGEGLRLMRELVGNVVAFATASQGLSEKGAATLKKLISNYTFLALAKEAHRTRVLSILDAYSETLDDDALATYGEYLEKLVNACEGMDASSEDDF